MEKRVGRSLESLVAAITPVDPADRLDIEWEHEWFDWEALHQASREHDARRAPRSTEP